MHWPPAKDEEHAAGFEAHKRLSMKLSDILGASEGFQDDDCSWSSFLDFLHVERADQADHQSNHDSAEAVPSFLSLLTS